MANPFDPTFDHLIDRHGTGSLKWDRYRGRDVIPMWVADMDFPAPPCVLDALHAHVDHGVLGYTLPTAEVTDAVVSGLESAHDWRIDPDWIVWLPGVVSALNVACRAVGKPGDGVVVEPPIYPPFMSAPTLSGRKTVSVPLLETPGGFRHDWDGLADALGPDAPLLALCSPHNPTGRAFSHDELSRIAALCRERDAIVCSDEIHCGLVLDPDQPHIPFPVLSDDAAQRCIVLMAPSKTYNIPGLSCSFAVIPNPELRRSFRSAAQGIVPDVNALGFTACAAAYAKGESWHQALISYLRVNHDLVAAAVADMPFLKATPVEATYLAWIDCRQLPVPDPAVFFEENGVGLSDGQAFAGPGFLRLNFGCPRPRLTEALRRMTDAVQELLNGSQTAQ
ncbi:MAG: putative C-S lyase [Lentisphaerae bacterium]|jgi:cysteine-S-conjugate beta-lyase|nr:putative C-S lyase [Lentisphaerota bacterium]MBT4817611.1 putative C-S lyase [Lentisphaerota bacterium]MBT5612590.1 putative C-S lyase [Lentisphaerota bacterium]MBT7055692.1 putative C-S lyase [Lentisphaerota bacterium]MBT7845820.1 putative C-S lyase [Lentisphaerota bacterium]